MKPKGPPASELARLRMEQFEAMLAKVRGVDHAARRMIVLDFETDDDAAAFEAWWRDRVAEAKDA